MTSERKITANRQNARRSRGPRSAAGKSKSSKNALRHGLSVSGLIDPGVDIEIDTLARAIAGKKPEPQRLAAARRIAEAQRDLDRIQAAKLALISSEIGSMRRAGPRGATAELSAPDPNQLNESYSGELSGKVLAHLAKFARYERRALSRRRQAMRNFSVTSERRIV
jgi:hypothetical protein